MNMFVFTGVLWKEDEEYSALCPELDVASQGKTLAEARKNLLEAASLHLEGSLEDGLPYLRPVPPSEDPLNLFPPETLETFKFQG